MSLARGTKLGPHEVIEPIGRGGMGEVYKARDTRLDRIVAIKVSQAQFSERFENEARAVAALNHPNICHLYDVGPNYLVMEFVEGTPLKGPLSIEKAVEYAGQILDALDAAHQKGITHRDLKPDNILVTKQGIKLLDFGLAKQNATMKESDATVTQALTNQGQILGTWQYMPPEQLQGRPADARSDLFSFGCVLYETLTGKRAFEGQSAASVIAAILEREPAPLPTPTPLDRILKRCLAKEPDLRFQTARDLKAALTWAMEQPIAAEVSSDQGSFKRSLWARFGGWRWVVAAGTLAIGAGGERAWSHFRQSSAEERSFRFEIDPPEGGRFVFGNSTGGIALSPDGKTAAYVAAGNGRDGLWVRPLDRTSARLIPGTEGAFSPFWSPDNKSIAFFTGTKLERVELSGGSPLAICDVAVGRGGAWSSDGRILFGTLASGMFQVAASGGTPPAPLTVPDDSRGQNSHRWPQMLPGGHFLYWVRSDRPVESGAYAGSFARPAEGIRLVTTDTNALYAPGLDGKDHLLWQRGGALFAQEFDVGSLKLAGEPHTVADPVAALGDVGQMNVTVSATGLLLYSNSATSSQFRWVNRAGKSLGAVGEPGAYGSFRLSPDGRRIALARSEPGANDLWLLEVERGVFSRFTSNPALSGFPVWSPDGRTVIYRSASSRNLYRRESSIGGNEERVSQSPNTLTPNDWSRDGRMVLYYELHPQTQRDLWILPVTTDGRPVPDAPARPYLRTRFNESYGRFSPEANPHWVAYQSDESGRYEIYIQAFPEPRGATRISTDGGQYPEWGPNGHELFYVSPDYKLMAVSVKLGEDSVVPSAPRELFPLPTVDIGWSPYEAASDGQRFLVRATSQQAVQPLTVIVNWPALLKKALTP